jgi:hypothetical protein
VKLEVYREVEPRRRTDCREQHSEYKEIFQGDELPGFYRHSLFPSSRVSETPGANSTLTRLIAREDLIVYCCSVGFKPCNTVQRATGSIPSRGKTFFSSPQQPMNRARVVGIATGYERDDRGVGSSSPGRGKNFLFSTSSRPALGLTQPPIQRVLGDLSPRVKRLGREADHSPPASAEVNNDRARLPLCHMSSWHNP